MHPKLLLGTNNRAKVREYQSLFPNIDYEIVTMAEQGISIEVEEVGESMEENARLKATVIAEKSRLLTLADDSGLEVDALGGEPGRLSARYAGENATDTERVEYLLKRMYGVSCEYWAASFGCVIALGTRDWKVELCAG